jgi:hypothetical protein
VNETARLRTALERAGTDFPKMAKLIDVSKQRRRARDPKWYYKLPERERAIWELINLVRHMGVVEAKLKRHEKRLGLKPGPRQDWFERLDRIGARRAAFER